jgi:hypothetical protein
VVTAHNLLEARQLRQQADSALAESLAEEARARSLQGATPRLPLPADALKADFARLTALQPFSTGLMTFLHRLADALDTLPGVELTTLEWALTPTRPSPSPAHSSSFGCPQPGAPAPTSSSTCSPRFITTPGGPARRPARRTGPSAHPAARPTPTTAGHPPRTARQPP